LSLGGILEAMEDGGVDMLACSKNGLMSRWDQDVHGGRMSFIHVLRSYTGCSWAMDLFALTDLPNVP